MLDVKNLSVKYGDLTIVDRLRFSVDEGQWLMIVGPNGAGKSTALRAITQGVPYTGQITFDGEDIQKKKPAALARCIGALMQSNAAAYAFSVEEVVALGRYAYSNRFLSGRGPGDEAAIEAALELTGMARQRRQSVLTLSGGELQRTFLAQVLAQDPKLLLLDEPTNHLDLVYQKQVFSIIQRWLETPGRAVVSVMHDLSLAKVYGTQVLLMDKGRSVAQGSAREVLVDSKLRPVYQMDVTAWMRGLLSQWED